MPYIYLTISVTATAMLSIMATLFTRVNKEKPNVSPLYNLIIASCACAGWGILYALEGGFHIGVLGYSLVYGLCYVIATTGLFGALRSGSVSLTSFGKQLSLAAVAVWGFLFWNTPLTVTVGTGMVLIVIAIYFCFHPEKEGTQKISLKWFLYIFMLIFGNVGCNVTQRYQQMAYHGTLGKMMMFFALIISVITCIILYLRDDPSGRHDIVRGSWVFPLIGGTCSVSLNLFVILLASTTLSPAVIYPTLAVGGMILTILFSVIFCKEKIMPLRWIGLGVGAVAIALLNL